MHFWHSPEGAKKSHENPSQYSWYPGGDSNRTPPRNKLEASLLEPGWPFPVRQDCLFTVSLRITELEILFYHHNTRSRSAMRVPSSIISKNVVYIASHCEVKLRRTLWRANKRKAPKWRDKFLEMRQNYGHQIMPNRVASEEMRPPRTKRKKKNKNADKEVQWIRPNGIMTHLISWQQSLWYSTYDPLYTKINDCKLQTDISPWKTVFSVSDNTCGKSLLLLQVLVIYSFPLMKI